MDALTKAWIRNTADLRAAEAGMRFNIVRAAHAAWWIPRYCRLYEGHHAGEPLVLRGAHTQPLWSSQLEWDAGGKEETIRYIREYMACRAAGDPCDWQLEVICRLFGWVYYNDQFEKWVRRFNFGIVFVAKKNKKSPMIAATSLYLLCGDGEPGQKVYLCAVTGDQAKEIAGRHTIEMVKASRDLSAVCKIDERLSRIEHLPSRSLLRPLHSGNVTSQKATEGLNGSGLIDEAHVVTSKFVGRIRGMGISRQQPLLLGFSTFGDDDTAWGYEQWEYGRKNNETGADLHYFFQSYEAKQTASDAEIIKNLDDYIRAANPALGHTVRLDEARRDCLKSKEKESTWAEAKKYRLNIWSVTKNRWLSADLWNASGVRRWKKPEAEEAAWGAVYLGYVDEPSAFTLVFPSDPARIDDAIAVAAAGQAGKTGDPMDLPLPALIRALDQKIRCKTWYWLPKGAIDAWGHAYPYGEWKASRAAKFQKGSALDMGGIARDIMGIVETCDVQAISYDRYTAGMLLGELCEAGYPEARCLPFARTQKQRWSFAVALLERLVLSRKFRHHQNAALDWEIGHAAVAPDDFGGAYLVEAERGNRKTVAGPASLLMALDGLGRSERHYRSECILL